MSFENLAFDGFIATKPFTFGKNRWHDEQDGIQIQNAAMDSLKTKGLEFHYEVIFDKQTEEYNVRLDCHIFPYAEFKNSQDYKAAVSAYYSAGTAKRILQIRKELKETYLDFGKNGNGYGTDGYYYGKQTGDNYLWLVQQNLGAVESEEELISSVYKFIANTYPILIKKLAAMKLF